MPQHRGLGCRLITLEKRVQDLAVLAGRAGASGPVGEQDEIRVLDDQLLQVPYQAHLQGIPRASRQSNMKSGVELRVDPAILAVDHLLNEPPELRELLLGPATRRHRRARDLDQQSDLVKLLDFVAEEDRMRHPVRDIRPATGSGDDEPEAAQTPKRLTDDRTTDPKSRAELVLGGKPFALLDLASRDQPDELVSDLVDRLRAPYRLNQAFHLADVRQYDRFSCSW